MATKKTTARQAPASKDVKTPAKLTSALKATKDQTPKEDADLSSLEHNDSATVDNTAVTEESHAAVSSGALRELFVDEIRDIYWAEKHLTKVLPKMQQAATSEVLADAIGEHIEETKTHVERLEQIFEILGEKAQAKKCEAIEGITKEGDSIVEDTEEGTATRDAGVILASQKIEHYEIATYGGLKQMATVLQMSDVADILDDTLEEEKAADEKLTQVAAGLDFADAE